MPDLTAPAGCWRWLMARSDGRNLAELAPGRIRWARALSGGQRLGQIGPGGYAGLQAFICMRCIVLAERLSDEGLLRLFHFTRATDKFCSFC